MQAFFLRTVRGEQSTLFGKQYSCTFDGSAVRTAVEDAARAAGYTCQREFFF